METMFTEQKWNILRELSSTPLSPLQLSEKLDTTMANISQQLRLLEACNLVKKDKIKNRDKGKPRTLFSLTGNHAFLIPAMNGFANKKLLQASDHHKAILRIWFIDDKSVHDQLEQFYWKLRANFSEVKGFLFDEQDKVTYVITDSLTQSELRKKTPLLVRTVSTQKVPGLAATLQDHDVAVLYDPHELLASSHQT